MQRNIKRINANNWMVVNTSGGMDELVTCLDQRRAHLSHEETSNQLQTALEEQLDIIHHTMVVDPRLGRKSQADRPHLGRPASIFD